MLEVIQGLLNMGLPPTLALAGGLGYVYWRTIKALRVSQAALKSCQAARRACNDEVHILKEKVSDLETAVLNAQGRVVALEELVEDYRRGDTSL